MMNNTKLVPLVCAQWLMIHEDKDMRIYCCTNCDEEYDTDNNIRGDVPTPYCPYCGAKMINIIIPIEHEGDDEEDNDATD